MDGASKFVRGDAIAALLITFINIVGGIIIGVAQQSMTFWPPPRATPCSRSATGSSARCRR
jgi:flagellar biosynthesis protein FlhA